MVCSMKWEVRSGSRSPATRVSLSVSYCRTNSHFQLLFNCLYPPLSPRRLLSPPPPPLPPAPLEDTVKGSMVEDFVAVVRGGDSESITWLAAKKLPTPQLMRLWGEAVHYNPDFIRSVVGILSLSVLCSRHLSRSLWYTLPLILHPHEKIL